jgi:hypothetical protein
LKALEGVKVLKIDHTVKFQQYCSFAINDVTFYLVYRSPNSPPEAMKDLEGLVKSVGRNSILIGDFNLPDIDWEAGTGARRSREFMDAAEEALLEQLVDFPTHIKGNCLDLVLTNMPERILELSDAGRLGSSDHVMLCLTVAMQVKDSKQDRPRLNWRKAD